MSVLERSRAAVFGHFPNSRMYWLVVCWILSYYSRHMMDPGTKGDISPTLVLVLPLKWIYHAGSKICFACNAKRKALIQKKISEAEYVFLVEGTLRLTDAKMPQGCSSNLLQQLQCWICQK